MAESANPGVRASVVGRTPTALVVENERALQELVRVHLENAGYNVILAPDAVVAGRTIVERPDAIDVLLVDAHLPFMSGIEFVSALIADSSVRMIPTIVIATSEQDARRAEILNVPCLEAPFRSDQLLDLVRRATEQPEAKHCVRRQRVVIADDEPDTVTSLSAIISHEGHSVFGTHRASEVLPEVKTSKPDAVILDIDMPGISGYTLAREIREIFGDASPLLVAVSGKWFSQTDKMLSELAGFDYFMQKPCHPDALLAILDRR